MPADNSRRYGQTSYGIHYDEPYNNIHLPCYTYLNLLRHTIIWMLQVNTGSNTENLSDRAAAGSIATRTIAGSAENPPLLAKHGRLLRAAKSRLN